MAGIKEAIIRRIAASHIAGPAVADALAICRAGAARGWSMTICPWTGPDTDPDRALALYEEALRSVSQERLDCRLSVKTPALGEDPGRVARLAGLARDAGIALHVDAHGPETAATALGFARAILGSNGRAGCTLPSRWRRSLEDAALARSLGLGVRLVKGQWNDTGGSIDHRENFLAIARALSGSASTVSVATHDAALARKALLILRESGTPCELELLFSLPLGVRKVAGELGVPVRLYAPYGHPYLPYNIMHVRTRPGIAVWALKNFLLGPSHRPH